MPYLDKMVDRTYFHDHSTGEPIRDLPGPEPCPFCGPSHRGGVVSQIGERGEPTFQVQCEGCGAMGPAAYSWREAASAWNRRSDRALTETGIRRLSSIAVAVIGLAAAAVAHEQLIAGPRIVPPSKIVPTGMHADKIREGLMIERRGGDWVRPKLPA